MEEALLRECWPFNLRSCKSVYYLVTAGLECNPRSSGLKVITTCSPNNYNLVKNLGADVVVDYHDPEICVQQIREYVGDNLQLVFDCISAFDSSKGRSSKIFNSSLPQNHLS